MSPSLAYNKRVGQQTEDAFADHAKSRGFCYAHRKRLTGVKDKGDIFISPLVQAAESKKGPLNVAGWIKEAEKEAEHAGSPVPVVLWRKRNTTNVGEWIAFLSYDALLDLLRRAEFPTDDDSLWRELWERAMDDVDTLLAALAAAGVEPPYVSTRKEPEAVGT